MATEMQQILNTYSNASNTLSQANQTTKSITDSIDLTSTLAFKLDNFLKDIEYSKQAKAIQLSNYFNNRLLQDFQDKIAMYQLQEDANRWNKQWNASEDMRQFNKNLALAQEKRAEDTFALNKKIMNAKLNNLLNQDKEQQNLTDLNINTWNQYRMLVDQLQKAKSNGDTSKVNELMKQITEINNIRKNNKLPILNVPTFNEVKKQPNTLLDMMSKGTINSNNFMDYYNKYKTQIDELYKANQLPNWANNIITKSNLNYNSNPRSIYTDINKYIDFNNMNSDLKKVITNASTIGSFLGIGDIKNLDKSLIGIRNNLGSRYENELKNNNVLKDGTPVTKYIVDDFIKNFDNYNLYDTHLTDSPTLNRVALFEAYKAVDPKFKIPEFGFKDWLSGDKSKKYLDYFRKHKDEMYNKAGKLFVGYKTALMKDGLRDGSFIYKDNDGKFKMANYEEVKPLIGWYILNEFLLNTQKGN